MTDDLERQALITRYEHVCARIRQYSQQYERGDSVHLLAVSKTKPAWMVETLFRQGQTDFGENYLQDALEKITQLRDLPINWHYIGAIQSNKTADIAANFAWVHSLDRLKIAQRLNEQRPDGLPPLKVCIQVNVGEEAQKSGVALAELGDFAQSLLQMNQLQLQGLMCIPRPEEEFEAQRAQFAQLRRGLAQLNEQLNLQLNCLSMGMSADLEAAVAEGASLVRIGTDIFGSRD